MTRRDPGALAQPTPFGPAGPLRGTAAIPGDKSITHRALMLAAMARGRSRIEGAADGSDLHSTAVALEAMGVGIARDGHAWTVEGVGTGCLLQPARALDMGNSGTSARLLMGLVASHRITAAFTGDASLCRRPMDRVIAPLRRIGAEVTASPGGRLPLMVRGLCPAVPRSTRLTIASAQVKSALLLAGLNIPGLTEIVEPVATRDHTERLLALFRAEIELDEQAGERRIALRGEAELRPQQVSVPGDPSAAAFLIVAALIVPGSEVRIEGVGVNPMRTGLFDTLRDMGAELVVSNRREQSGEPVADVVARSSALRGIEVPPAAIPAMIDEFPIFFVAAAFAEGESRTSGLAELRIKESDRIAAMAEGLRAIGAEVGESDDGLVIGGSGGAALAGGAAIASELDHRIAMSFAVAGLHCRQPLLIDDMAPVETSFPAFEATLAGLLGHGRGR
ncbi:MAG TPA: 3-phosphoshikimate 1-carboxyvinyltransferase [Allosphingosinicella sp.]|nr:3-phosphoshikimate 1-carboxyvinyltransferase [Allosphingosinicella sp.]